jgi:hypothetical protein
VQLHLAGGTVRLHDELAVYMSLRKTDVQAFGVPDPDLGILHEKLRGIEARPLPFA